MQELQSAAVTPVGNFAFEQVVHVFPIKTLPLGQMHNPAVLLQERPLRQIHPRSFAKPLEKRACAQLMQEVLTGA